MSETIQGQISASGLYRHSTVVSLDDGSVVYRLPERLRYLPMDGTISHVCVNGELLWDIAVLYYGRWRSRALDLWEVLAQFQPSPILDASVPLKSGKVILVPPVEYIEEIAYGTSLATLPAI